MSNNSPGHPHHLPRGSNSPASPDWQEEAIDLTNPSAPDPSTSTVNVTDLDLLQDVLTPQPRQEYYDYSQSPEQSDESPEEGYSLVMAESDSDEEEDEGSAEPPTTILLASEDEPEESLPNTSSAPDPVLIPATIEVGEEGTSQETSAASYNSFWKYKKFPKGPKVRQTYELDISAPDPHKPIIFNDPVFDKSQRNVARHFGKQRIGEGNDITPNPEKLSQLGKDIEYVNARMLSLGDSTAERREKMKLSSRICRMKRSANHEANKIKFAGLEREREELCKLINRMKSAISSSRSISTDRVVDELYSTKVAGRTSEYVNNVLEQTEFLESQGGYLSTDSESD